MSKSKEKKDKKRKSKRGDSKLYATNNILALSLKHYDMCLKKDEKIPSEQLQEFTYDRLERDEQEFLIGVMVEGKVTIKKDSYGNIIRLEAEVDMLDLINFLGLTAGGKRYGKLREILERLKTKEVTKIVTKEENNKRVIHSIAKGVTISDFEFYRKDDNKLYELTKFEQFRRIAIKLYFSKTFSELLMNDNRIAFYKRNKNTIRKIQKQPTYARDIINYMIPIMGDKELDLSNVIEDIYENRNTAKTAKQKLLKAYQEGEVKNLFLLCGLKIDVDNQKIVKKVKGFRDKDDAKVDPTFFMLGRAQ